MASADSTVVSAHQQHQQEAMGMAGEARNVKQARQQAAASGGGERKPRPPQEQALACPRCESTNTKFCYYNNYSLSQPRYFCKACRRYWTQGGTLRNVPVGGGCRKNRRSSSSSAAAAASIPKMIPPPPHLLPGHPMAPASATADFPNVLPTFMSTTGFELHGPEHHHLSQLPFAPSLAPAMQGGVGPSSFLEILRQGLLDAGSSHQSDDDVFSNRMVRPPPLPSFGDMQRRVGGSRAAQGVDDAGDDGGVKAMMGHAHQWAAAQDGNNNIGGVADMAGPGLQFGGGVHQQEGNAGNNNVMMGSSNGGSSTGRDYYWNNDGNGGASGAAANPTWQGGGGGLINSGSLI
ncbi:hypothetical protein ACP70R_021761 [Stipagrostis hirtigluma subsp. patula]